MLQDAVDSGSAKIRLNIEQLFDFDHAALRVYAIFVVFLQ
jgi:hypothetical protein